MNDFRVSQRQVGDDMDGGEDLANRQSRDGREHVGMELERRWSTPGAFNRKVTDLELDDLADAVRTVAADDIDQSSRASGCGV